MADVVTQGLTAIGDVTAKLDAGKAASAPLPDMGSLLGNISMTTIMIGLVAGLVGSGYFMYGKRTCNIRMLCSGLALCVVPYFIGNTVLLVLSCAAIAVAPFVFPA